MTSTTGHRESKVGLIPTDWSVAAIGDVSSLVINGFVGTATPYHTDDDDGVTYIQGYNVRPNRIDLTNVTKVTREFSVRHTKSTLQAGDMLTVQSGHIGTSATVPQELAGANCHAVIITRFFKDKVCPDFVAYYFNSTVGRNRLRALEVGSSVLHILTKDLRKFRVPLPPLPAQRNIAEILGTWDEAIALTGRRIEAARQHKKGLMQRLLTGRVRFPEFEGEEWRTVRFHDVFQRITRKNESENQNVLTMSAQLGLVSQTEYFHKRVASKTLSHYYLLKKGEFAYNKSYSSGYPFGAVKRLDDYEEGVLSTLYICFRLRSAARYDSDFFTHFFEAGRLNKGIYAIAQEGARNHGLLNISISSFFDLAMTVPSYEEQKRIASVLNACDREVELLTQKRDALQRQKKGLMQQLLTGRVRV